MPHLAKSVFFICTISGLANILKAAENLSIIISSEPEEPTIPNVPSTGDLVEDAIQTLERRAATAKAVEDRGLPLEVVERSQEVMVQQLDVIMELLKEPHNVFKFIEAKGIDRVILPHLTDYNTEFRSKLLSITKLLFETAPTTTNHVIPIEILDNLLDLFEDEDSLDVKEKIIDILYAWLPENPKVQLRVMKLKGLDSFYDQIRKLDASIIETKLKLFSKILKEHVRIRYGNQPMTKPENLKLNIYKRIGLIEKMSSRSFCVGIMNIFNKLVDPLEKYYAIPILDILIDIQQFCTGHFAKQTRAAHFFRDLQKHIEEMDESTRWYYGEQGLNVTQIEDAVRNYVKEMTEVRRDEF